MRYNQTVVQASKSELVFNVHTARMIGFIVPTSVLNCADKYSINVRLWALAKITAHRSMFAFGGKRAPFNMRKCPLIIQCGSGT